MPRSISILLFLVVIAAAGSARAGGFATGRYAGEHGHVATDHPTAIYFNPAGLALGTGWRIYAEGLLAWRTVDYDRPDSAISNLVDEGETGTPSDAAGVNAGKASLSDIIAAPFLGVATDLGVPNLGIGLAFYAPFGGQSKWDENEAFAGDMQYPGAQDGVQRWHVIEGEIRSLFLTLAGAYRLEGPRLSFGLGVSVVRSNVHTVRARTVSGTDDVVAGNGAVLEGRSYVDVAATDLAASAGITWEAMPNLWIGASYQSKVGFGFSTMDGTLVNKFGSDDVEENDILFEQDLPDIIRLGARFKASPELELRLSGDYQRWSVFEHQCLMNDDPDSNCTLTNDGAATDETVGIIQNIPREWNDTFGVRGGASYWILPELEINWGVNFDSSAVPDRTIDASLLDSNKLIAIAGVEWATIPDQLLLSLTVNNVFYFKRTVGPRDDGEIGSVAPSTVPDGAGTYEQNVLFVNLGAEYRF